MHRWALPRIVGSRALLVAVAVLLFAFWRPEPAHSAACRLALVLARPPRPRRGLKPNPNAWGFGPPGNPRAPTVGVCGQSGRVGAGACNRWGYSLPIDPAVVQSMYPDPLAYFFKVAQVDKANLIAGYILQADMVADIRAKWAMELRRVLGVLPTGGGKTEVAIRSSETRWRPASGSW